MPTNKERREVAARLRVLASNKAADEELVLDALGLYRGDNTEGFDTHCVMDLADIIEPEPVCIANITITEEQVEKIKSDILKELEQPELTCELDSQVCGKRRCKRCGAFVSVDSVWDCSGCIPAKYCPNCGAKVIGG